MIGRVFLCRKSFAFLLSSNPTVFLFRALSLPVHFLFHLLLFLLPTCSPAVLSLATSFFFSLVFSCGNTCISLPCFLPARPPLYVAFASAFSPVRSSSTAHLSFSCSLPSALLDSHSHFADFRLFRSVFPLWQRRTRSFLIF